jgi:hypothetical protein
MGNTRLPPSPKSEKLMFRRAALSLALLGGFAASQASAQSCDTSIQVVNNSGSQVDELYFNPSSNSNWGADRLGQNVLASGRSANFRPNRGGNHDFRVVWSGGREAEIRGVDVCSVSRIIVGRGRLSAE